MGTLENDEAGKGYGVEGEREKEMSAVIIHIYRGPSSEKCRCNCNEDGTGTCEHVWDGPERDLADYGAYGMTETCGRCGMMRFTHDSRQ